jgi:hypothetical protein
MKLITRIFKERPLVKLILACFLFLYSLLTNAQDEIPPYKPINKLLQLKITQLDSIYFNAYNTCDMKKQASLYSEDIEFFHDKAGLATSKKEILNSIKQNICGKVTRSLVPGSIEVYPIKDYGAIEIGYHKFINKEVPLAKSIPSKFIIVWQKLEEKWTITKVISLH